MLESADLQFRRQFIVGPDRARMPAGWVLHVAAPSLWLATHPELRVTSASSGAVKVICLGHVFDTSHPERTNQEVLDRFVQDTDAYEKLLATTLALGGRWLMILAIGTQTRLYLDAAGTRSAFHFREPSGGLWIGAQPGLLAEMLSLARDDALESQFLGGNHGNAWPAQRTPFPGVRQLLPNHFLDLVAGVPRRYSPVRAMAPLSLAQAVRLIDSTLHGLIQAITMRGPVAAPLTAGYDSRLLFCSARECREHIDFFTIVDPNTPHPDGQIPGALSQQFQVPVTKVQAQAIPDWFWKRHRQNVSEMFWDPGEIKYFSLGRHFGHHTVLTGGVAEIGRCFYYPSGVHPVHPGATTLAALSGYAGNRVAIEAFEEWLSEATSIESIALLDLFYWEHRIGNWMAMSMSAYDTVCEAIPAFNCRQYISAVLAVDVQQRREPYELFRHLCEAALPGSTQLPFNASVIDDFQNRFRHVVPWRIRNGLRRWRLRRAGLDQVERH